jgi:two-component system, OmpR family, alkaline phosphatase synthesis response regulator PhoP
MRRVLVIDDEADVRLLYRVNLRHAGFEVLEAEDGERGIDAALEHLPDAVVLDLMMPRVDGFEVLRVLRAHPDASEMPVLVLTADSRSDHHRRCYELGADEVMTKPFVPDALTRGISRMLATSLQDRVDHRVEAAEAARGAAYG